MTENTITAPALPAGLKSNPDAAAWAKAFVEHARFHPGLAIDDAAMTGWFADAIAAGFKGERKIEWADDEYSAVIRRVKHIGIHGRKRAGKDTTARFITEHLTRHGMVVHKQSFADPLKACTRAMFGGTDANYYGEDIDRHVPLPFWEARHGDAIKNYRRMLQTVGTEVFRHYHPRWWLDMYDFQVLQALKAAGCEPEQLVVMVPDVRFDNEALYIQRQGGRVIEVINLNLPPNTDGHASEKGLSEAKPDLVYSAASVPKVAENAAEAVVALHTYLGM